jgi:hypothetical protein
MNQLRLSGLFICLSALIFCAGCLPEGSGGRTSEPLDSSDDVDAGCTRDDVCERGTVCRVGVCQVVECSTKADCGPNRTCIPELQQCTQVDCISSLDCDNSAGLICSQGLCTKASPGYCESREDCAADNQVCDLLTQACIPPPISCQSDDQCVVPQRCDAVTQTCALEVVACSVDSQCSTNKYCDTNSSQCRDGCRVDGCDEGFVCDTATRSCALTERCTVSACAADGGKACDLVGGRCRERTGDVTLCGLCTAGSLDECGAPGIDRCTPIGPDSGRCVYSCQLPTHCPTGFTCSQILSSSNKFCVPTNGRCQGCLVDGCPDNFLCSDSGACIAPKALCAECNPGECAQDARCALFGSSTRCLDLCDGGCPANTVCNTTTNLCQPISGSCEATACPGVSCAGSTVPYLNEQTCTCVACLDSSHCGGNQCNNGACASCSCPPGTQCGANNACIPIQSGCGTCPQGATCDTQTQTCYTPGACVSDSDCRVNCNSMGVCLCTGETDTQSCRPDEECIGIDLFPGFNTSGCFASGTPPP